MRTADFNGFLNPSIINGESYRPDLLFLIQSKCPYVLELTVGFHCWGLVREGVAPFCSASLLSLNKV